jgi:phage terminase large subunit-like protein
MKPSVKKPAKPRAKTRGDKVCAFIEKYCLVPEGAKVGQPMVLDPFQRHFILDVYDNPHGTSRAYLSLARKNGKTALIAAIVLAHIAGPEAVLNSQIVSGAMSREQAAIVFKLASKMINLSPKLSALVRIMPSAKSLIGLALNVEYRALSAEGKTAHGLSPVLAILDEVGQVRGPNSPFIDAIITAQGAHAHPLVIVISTQAANDSDLLSIWLDDAHSSGDPRIISHVHTAPKECPLSDADAWRAANPALGSFRSLQDITDQAVMAERMPSFEPTFRNLCLNQRVEMAAPFVSKSIWQENGAEPDEEVFRRNPVFVALDLSGKVDLTAMAMAAVEDGVWHVKLFFWTPAKGLEERAKRDRAPYNVWAASGFIRTITGSAVDYEAVAKDMAEILDGIDVHAVAFDRWRFDLLKKEMDEIGLSLNLVPFGQGFRDMAPALDKMEEVLMNGSMAHGNNPVLTMCMANCRVEKDAAGNRKLNKAKATGRIDGAVALTMCMGIAASEDAQVDLDDFIFNPIQG